MPCQRTKHEDQEIRRTHQIGNELMAPSLIRISREKYCNELKAIKPYSHKQTSPEIFSEDIRRSAGTSER
eukprot:10945138-Ditylum_brightwellii.AAC.2